MSTYECVHRCIEICSGIVHSSVRLLIIHARFILIRLTRKLQQVLAKQHHMSMTSRSECEGLAHSKGGLKRPAMGVSSANRGKTGHVHAALEARREALLHAPQLAPLSLALLRFDLCACLRLRLSARALCLQPRPRLLGLPGIHSKA